MNFALLQSLVQEEIPPHAINLDALISFSEKYPNPQSNEYKIIENALNIILGYYLSKAARLLPSSIL